MERFPGLKTSGIPRHFVPGYDQVPPGQKAVITL
jgi:hypothetical protein